jgi:hypothetical protein
MVGSLARITLVCAALGISHSALASKQAKELAARTFGRRYRNGLYRFSFTAISALQFAWLAWYVFRQPDRPLYRVPSPWSWLMRVGQFSGLVWGFITVVVLGLPDFNGIPQMRALLAGEEPTPEPEAQGPDLGEDGEMRALGPYSLTRHPNNLSPAILFLLEPNMTANRAWIAFLSVLYALVGSYHEEARLKAKYGEAYERYRRRVPFYLPLRGSKAR